MSKSSIAVKAKVNDSKNFLSSVEDVREHVTRAALILRELDPEFERLSWLLEDTLLYLDESLAKMYPEDTTPSKAPSKANVSDNQKQANSS